MKKFLKGDPKPIIFNESKYRFSKKKKTPEPRTGFIL